MRDNVMKIRIAAVASSQVWYEMMVDIERAGEYSRKTSLSTKDGRFGLFEEMLKLGIQHAVVSAEEDYIEGNDVATVVAYGPANMVKRLDSKHGTRSLVRGAKLQPSKGNNSTGTTVTQIDTSDIESLVRKGIAVIETPDGAFAFSKGSAPKGKKMGELKTSAQYPFD